MVVNLRQNFRILTDNSLFSLFLQISRGGQSVTLVGASLVIFGGQDANRSLLNDLHILDLESMTWDEFDAVYVIFCFLAFAEQPSVGDGIFLYLLRFHRHRLKESC